MELGSNATQTIDIVSRTAKDRDYRQLASIGREGPPAAFTGRHCMNIVNEATSEDAVAVGNLLSSPSVPEAMVAAFGRAEGHLARRLVCAMRAGLDAGGETEDVRSAGLVVTHQLAWPIVDLRVDWTLGCPISELEQLWAVWEPRMSIYLARALQPADAPTTDTEVITT